MNKIILKGNIGHAPRISLTQEGREIATFSLATNTSWKEESGEWQTHTDWHRVIVFRKGTVGWIKNVLKKGDTIYVEGKLTYHRKKDEFNRPCLRSYIVISDAGGKIEYLRSRKPHQTEEEAEETRLLENDSPCSGERPSISLENSEESSHSVQPIHLEKEKI